MILGFLWYILWLVIIAVTLIIKTRKHISIDTETILILWIEVLLCLISTACLGMKGII